MRRVQSVQGISFVLHHECPLRLLTACRGPNGAARQAAALRQEGVTVQRGSMGEHSIDFATYGWFPIMLPSEEAELEQSDSDGSDSER